MEEHIVLQGRHVRLEPYSPEHLPQLREALDNDEVFACTFHLNPFRSDAATAAYFGECGSDARIFTIFDLASGGVAGTTRFFDIDERFRKCEIGYTAHAPEFWRTAVNTEAKLLLLTYAFERWNAVRVQLKAEAVNRRSHRAILRLGATHEGTLRAYRIRSDGSVRDVNMYSIVAPDWPAIKERLTSLSDRSRDTREAG